ncbi:phage antirepressor N-terminal domain-containing protein [Schaalia sp. lx-100]|uniref:phage antirepressor N-terminal domain-containing protein n=1 Tax=Schaalia sp. lx-100 TaxID=2899081 RepID=UPI001E3714EF|nr:phage antirepressor N-terminal domain-containing protein [Schaalia sp. lx-100]MCD4557637.1 phage antirepressor N-terminal domain-containing protein [Schaalia sp. lx-100]
MTNVIRIPFYGAEIITNGDGSQIALMPVCDALGLDYLAQYRRLKRRPWATMSMMPITGSDGKTRDYVAVSRRTFTMWLATIGTSRARNDHAKRMIVAYQTEAIDTLEYHFHKRETVKPGAVEHQVSARIRQATRQMELCQAARGLIHPEELETRARLILAHGLGGAA